MADALPKVLVKFKPSLHLPYRDDIGGDIDAATGGAWQSLTAKFPGIQIRRLFRKVDIVDLAQKATNNDPQFHGNPTSLFVIQCAVP